MNKRKIFCFYLFFLFLQLFLKLRKSSILKLCRFVQVILSLGFLYFLVDKIGRASCRERVCLYV